MCWPWTHKWTKWFDSGRVMSYRDEDGDVYSGVPVFMRVCEKCGRPQRKEF